MCIDSNMSMAFIILQILSRSHSLFDDVVLATEQIEEPPSRDDNATKVQNGIVQCIAGHHGDYPPTIVYEDGRCLLPGAAAHYQDN